MIEPVKLSDFSRTPDPAVPDEIIESYNQLIKSKWDGKSAKIYQNEVSFYSKYPDSFGLYWLHVDKIFRSAGWEITYVPDGGYAVLIFG